MTSTAPLSLNTNSDKELNETCLYLAGKASRSDGQLERLVQRASLTTQLSIYDYLAPLLTLRRQGFEASRTRRLEQLLRVREEVSKYLQRIKVDGNGLNGWWEWHSRQPTNRGRLENEDAQLKALLLRLGLPGRFLKDSTHSSSVSLSHFIWASAVCVTDFEEKGRFGGRLAAFLELATGLWRLSGAGSRERAISLALHSVTATAIAESADSLNFWAPITVASDNEDLNYAARMHAGTVDTTVDNLKFSRPSRNLPPPAFRNLETLCLHILFGDYHSKEFPEHLTGISNNSHFAGTLRRLHIWIDPIHGQEEATDTPAIRACFHRIAGWMTQFKWLTHVGFDYHLLHYTSDRVGGMHMASASLPDSLREVAKTFKMLKEVWIETEADLYHECFSFDCLAQFVQLVLSGDMSRPIFRVRVAEGDYEEMRGAHTSHRDYPVNSGVHIVKYSEYPEVFPFWDGGAENYVPRARVPKSFTESTPLGYEDPFGW
ncbi:hypothetical protein T439DRAFT_353159 [Meredithblackwellia eburnea MCA 4105]